jgi:hypothetical protein
VLGKRGSILRYEAQETDSGEQSPNRELKPNAGWVDENVVFLQRDRTQEFVENQEGDQGVLPTKCRGLKSKKRREK